MEESFPQCDLESDQAKVKSSLDIILLFLPSLDNERERRERN